jgi:hypothetical protein
MNAVCLGEKPLGAGFATGAADAAGLAGEEALLTDAPPDSAFLRSINAICAAEYPLAIAFAATGMGAAGAVSPVGSDRSGSDRSKSAISSAEAPGREALAPGVVLAGVVAADARCGGCGRWFGAAFCCPVETDLSTVVRPCFEKRICRTTRRDKISFSSF